MQNSHKETVRKPRLGKERAERDLLTVLVFSENNIIRNSIHRRVFCCTGECFAAQIYDFSRIDQILNVFLKKHFLKLQCIDLS